MIAMSQTFNVEDRRKNPFVMVDKALFSINLKCASKMIYIALCSFTYGGDSCHPGVKTLSEMTNVSVRCVYPALDELEAAGLISRVQNQGYTSTYRIYDIPEQKPETPKDTCANPAQGGVRNSHKGCADSAHEEEVFNNNKKIKDYSPSERANEAPPVTPAQASIFAEEPATAEPPLPIEEIPQAMKQTADYLLLKTNRAHLVESELSPLRVMNKNHFPAVVQQEIDKATERFERLQRDPRTLTFVYIAEALKFRAPTRASPGGKDKAPAKAKEDFSDLRTGGDDGEREFYTKDDL